MIAPPVAVVEEASRDMPEDAAVSPETLTVVPLMEIAPPLVVSEEVLMEPTEAEPVRARSITAPGLAPAVEVEVTILYEPPEILEFASR